MSNELKTGDSFTIRGDVNKYVVGVIVGNTIKTACGCLIAKSVAIKTKIRK